MRRADPAGERKEIHDVLARNLPAAAPADRLKWLYGDNPDGPALVWLALDNSGTPVGTSAAHPRRMRVRGETVRALNLSDFAIDTAYRTLGPALKLLRATLDPVREGEFAFSYDYPSAAMRAIYLRMGSPDLGPEERWVRPVDVRAFTERRLGSALGSVVGSAGNLVLRARAALDRGRRDIDVSPLSGDFTEEFDRLDQALGDSYPVRGVRDAAYLRWRYRAHTMWEHDVLCARRKGALSGFAVLRREADGVQGLVDLVAHDTATARALVSAAVDSTREAGAAVLQAHAPAGGPAGRLLEDLGFHRRESGPGPVPFTATGSRFADILKQSACWWLMGGDRDI